MTSLDITDIQKESREACLFVMFISLKIPEMTMEK